MKRGHKSERKQERVFGERKERNHNYTQKKFLKKKLTITTKIIILSAVVHACALSTGGGGT